MEPGQLLDLLVSASGTLDKPEKKKELQEAIAQADIDWQQFFAQAAAHRLLPRVCAHLLSLESPCIPEVEKSKQREAIVQIAFRNLRFVKQLLDVLTLLDRHDIRAVPFKGPVLAQYLYGDIARREFGDLDILINLADWPKTYTLLLSSGYRPEIEIPPGQLARYATAEDNLSFSHVDGVPLEVHWELSGRLLARPFDAALVSTRLQEMEFQNHLIPILSAEDLLVYFCLHGVKHDWSHLDQIACIADLLEKEPHLNWSVVFDIASRLGCRRMVLFGLFLAQRMYHVGLPLTVHEQMLHDTIIQSQGQVTLAFITRRIEGFEKSTSSVQRARFSVLRWRIRDSILDALRYLFRVLFWPTKAEWRVYPVPDHLVFCYWIVRPFRVLGAAVLGTFRDK